MDDVGIQILIPQNHCESLIDSNQTCYSRKNFAISVKQGAKLFCFFCIRPTGLVPLLYPLILSFIAGEWDVVSITHDASEAGRIWPHMLLWPPAHVAGLQLFVAAPLASGTGVRGLRQPAVQLVDSWYICTISEASTVQILEICSKKAHQYTWT